MIGDDYYRGLSGATNTYISNAGTMRPLPYREAVKRCFEHTSDVYKVLTWLEEAGIVVPSPNSIPFD